MLIDIEEPQTQNPAQSQLVVGIDFGTTNSLIAISCNKEVKIIPTNEGTKLLPSIVNLGGLNIKSIKRLFGKNVEEVKEATYLSNKIRCLAVEHKGSLALQLGDEIIYPIEIGAEIFKKLKKQAESFTQEKITKAVITVPAYFDDTAKSMIKDSAKLAGLEVLRLIAEPTAAAYAYGLDNNSQGRYLVYDLGGGTFDVSIINIIDGVFQVIATGGNPELGGDDIDLKITEYLQEKYRFKVKNDNELELISIAKNLKESISSVGNAYSIFDEYKFELTEKELQQIALPLVNNTIQITKSVLERAEINNLNGIILVGGATRIPMIKKLLSDSFNAKIFDDFDPDIVVALGAALQAENLTTKSDLLIDVTPLSLGIELIGGVVEKIIPRNTPIPVSIQKKYTTYADNQTGILFHVVQGDREFAKDCRSLARFEIKNIPPMPAGAAKIHVNFAVDADGLMFITAEEITTGYKQEIQIKPSYGLSEEVILDMLKSAMEHAEDDHIARLKQNAINEAKTLIHHVEQAISKHRYLLSLDQETELKKNINLLLKVTISAETDQITLAKNEFEKKIAFFAELILSAEVEGYLRGKKIEEI